MEELTEVITCAEFHPMQCNTLVYSSSKGALRLTDMRMNALCDSHAKSIVKNNWQSRISQVPAFNMLL